MKKKLAVVVSALFAFSLLFGSSAALAASTSMDPNAPGPAATPKWETKLDNAQKRLTFLQDIKPLLETIANNRQQIKTLKTTLVDVCQASQNHIKALKADVANVTSEQLARLSDLLEQIKQVRIDLNASNSGMETQLQNLRGGRKQKNYDGIKAAYENIIRVQQRRIECFRKLTDLYNQVALV